MYIPRSFYYRKFNVICRHSAYEEEFQHTVPCSVLESKICVAAKLSGYECDTADEEACPEDI
ncbi:hypothetical protein VP1G_11431 [Cytospora mali]|uniref:Uncharacterized protein n=1 Tax=Cytospora mali TaxID=578113 RepID=A0A194VFJ5_CYTMA|nr:hypothetical protein VP1G_11431 [Valsa mali var. pyri (nom. inval.)]